MRSAPPIKLNMRTARADGGAGAVKLADAVVDACAATRADPDSSFKFLYPAEASIKVRDWHR